MYINNYIKTDTPLSIFTTNECIISVAHYKCVDDFDTNNITKLYLCEY